MSGTRRFRFGIMSAVSKQFSVMADLIRSWIGLESVSGRPTYAQYITDLRLTNHIPSVAELRPTRPRTLSDKTNTTPTYNQQTTDNFSGRDLSNIFENFLPDKFVCPNINRHQTDKIESIPTLNQFLPEFDDFCQFEVGFVSVWPMWLGYEDRILLHTNSHTKLLTVLTIDPHTTPGLWVHPQRSLRPMGPFLAYNWKPSHCLQRHSFLAVMYFSCN